MKTSFEVSEMLEDARGKLNALSVNLYGLFSMLAHGDCPDSEAMDDLNILYTNDLEQVINQIKEISRDYDFIPKAES